MFVSQAPLSPLGHKAYHCESPSICSQNPGGVAAENGNLQTPRQEGQDDLERVNTQLQIR